MACVPTPGRPGGAHAKATTRYLTDVSPPTSETWLDAGHLDRSDPGQRAGRIDAARVARAGHRIVGHGWRLRRRLCLRLHQHAVLAGPATPLPMQNNPRAVFERLFGDSRTTDARAPRGAAARGSQRARLGAARSWRRCRPRSARPIAPSWPSICDSVRDVERRIQAAESRGASELPVLDRPAGVPGSYEDHVRLMFDLQVLAYQTDVTRVVTFMLGREFSGVTYPQIGVPDAHHPITHHQQEAEKIAKVAKINHYHVTQFAYLLERMRVDARRGRVAARSLDADVRRRHRRVQRPRSAAHPAAAGGRRRRAT